MSRLPITTESVTFSFRQEASSLPQDVQVAYSHVRTSVGSPIDTLGVLGLGNEGAAAARAAQLAGKLGVLGVAFAGALPYWKTAPTEDGIRRLACESTAAIANDIAEKHNPSLLHAFGESQGGPAVLESASQTAQITGNIALLRPLGFQGPLKVSTFAGRMLRTGMQPDQFSCPYSLVIAAHASRRFAKDATRHKGALFQYALGGYNGVPALQELISQGRNVAVIAATNDRVFPPHKLRETLRGVTDIIEIPGSHSTLASPAGARQLPSVLSICRIGMLPAKNHLEVQ